MIPPEASHPTGDAETDALIAALSILRGTYSGDKFIRAVSRVLPYEYVLAHNSNLMHMEQELTKLQRIRMEVGAGSATTIANARIYPW